MTGDHHRYLWCPGKDGRLHSLQRAWVADVSAIFFSSENSKQARPFRSAGTHTAAGFPTGFSSPIASFRTASLIQKQNVALPQWR